MKFLKLFAIAVLIPMFTLNLSMIQSEAKMYPPAKETKSIHYYIMKDAKKGKAGEVSAKLQNKTSVIEIPETVTIGGSTYRVTAVTGLNYPDCLDASPRTDALKTKKNNKTRKVIIPKSVKQVDKGTFTNFSKLEEISVHKKNRHLKTVKGALVSRDGKILYGVPALKGTYQVPRGIEVIAGRTFAYSEVEKVILPESCRFIKTRAFYKARKLKEIRNLSNVKKLGANVFYGTKLKI